VGGVRRDGGQNQYCAVFVSRGGWYQVTVYFRLPSSPSTLSRIVDHKTTRTRACAAGGWRVAWTPFDHNAIPSTVDEPALMRVYWPIQQ